MATQGHINFCMLWAHNWLQCQANYKIWCPQVWCPTIALSKSNNKDGLTALLRFCSCILKASLRQWESAKTSWNIAICGFNTDPISYKESWSEFVRSFLSKSFFVPFISSPRVSFCDATYLKFVSKGTQCFYCGNWKHQKYWEIAFWKWQQPYR